MDRETRRQIEEYRRSAAGPIENNLIDEFVASELDRQEFIRRAAMFGLGAGTIGALLRFVGEADLAFGAPAAPAKKGGTLRVGNLKPTTGDRPDHEQHPGCARGDEHHGRVPALHGSPQQRAQACARNELQTG